MNAFSEAALVALSRAYPERPVLIDHGLSGHPLLELESLISLSGRMRDVDVEYNKGDLPIGLDPAATPVNGLSAAETLRRIAECGSWMVLKFIEQDESYRRFLDELLDDVVPAVRMATGAMLKREGFIFVSSPGAVTPYHFDPEHNILLQVRGTKTMTILAPGDERFASAAEHERFHSGGHRNLPWRDEFATHGRAFPLGPGKAVYVPVKAPHWVQNGPEVSVSLSITWRSEWSYREEYARRMNEVLRRAGLRPRAPGRYPHQNHLKSFAYRAIERAKRLAGEGPGA